MTMNQKNKVPSTWGPGGLISFKGRGGGFQGNCKFILDQRDKYRGAGWGWEGCKGENATAVKAVRTKVVNRDGAVHTQPMGLGPMWLENGQQGRVFI